MAVHPNFRGTLIPERAGVSEMAENNTADRRDDATPKRELIKREVAMVKEKLGEALRRLANS